MIIKQEWFSVSRVNNILIFDEPSGVQIEKSLIPSLDYKGIKIYPDLSTTEYFVVQEKMCLESSSILLWVTLAKNLVELILPHTILLFKRFVNIFSTIYRQTDKAFIWNQCFSLKKIISIKHILSYFQEDCFTISSTNSIDWIRLVREIRQLNNNYLHNNTVQYTT